MTRVSDALGRGAVLVRPNYTTFADTIEGLVGALSDAGGLPATLTDVATRMVQEREAVSSTAMVEISVSIPHTRLDGVDQILAGLAVSPGGVYEVTDGLPICIVVLVLTPTDLVNEHLEFLHSLSLLLQSAHLRERLQHAITPEDILLAIRENERGLA
jgi:mannitol/fructose-specific phosphotransferase system IIA component (Ntr-type)